MTRPTTAAVNIVRIYRNRSATRVSTKGGKDANRQAGHRGDLLIVDTRFWRRQSWQDQRANIPCVVR